MAQDVRAAERGTNEDASRPEKEEASTEKLSITMDKRIDLAIALAIVLLGVLMLVWARDIQAGQIPDPITSRGLPNIMGIFFIIGGSILGMLRLKTWSALPGNFVPEEGKTDEKGHPASWVRTFGIATGALLWVWLLDPLGYVFVTPLFMLVFLLVMGVRSWMQIIGFPTIFTLATWYIFSQVLQIILPLGPLAPFLRSLGLTP
jgi:putative tricarboxylic transport membrane protein